MGLCLVGWLEEGLHCYRKIRVKATGVIADQIYAHLDQEKLLPEEQKGCRKGSTGTNDLHYIDRTVIKEIKSRNNNLARAWIDHKKAYDMVPHL